MNLLEAMDEEALFAPWFRGRETWLAWRSLIAALFGLPMTPAMLDVFKECTGRSEAPTAASEEGWLVTGRRGGKSRVMALIAVFLACFRSYSEYLAPGERATILVLAADKRQARTVLRYIKGMMEAVPMLRKKITGETAWSLDLDNMVSIEIATASFRTSRGYSFAAVICDEIAFWRNDADAAEPDFEILDAIRPGMATIPGSVLLCASSPYARRGALWDAFKRWYGKDDKPLVWKASTRRMNPTVPQTVIDRAMERDEASARAEYGAEFRTDIEALFTREAVAAVVEPKCLERPYDSAYHYVAFVDPSGGSADSMTLAIAHAEGDLAML
ncbi:MAG: terminase large subunit domain-containing protein, partial [Cypionkella sp.]